MQCNDIYSNDAPFDLTENLTEYLRKSITYSPTVNIVIVSAAYFAPDIAPRGWPELSVESCWQQMIIRQSSRYLHSVVVEEKILETVTV